MIKTYQDKQFRNFDGEKQKEIWRILHGFQGTLDEYNVKRIKDSN